MNKDEILKAKKFVLSYLYYMGFDDDFIDDNFNIDILAEICYNYYITKNKENNDVGHE